MHDLRTYIRTYDGALTADFCARLISGFEQTADRQIRNGRGVRAGLEGSAWTEVDVGGLADEAFNGFFLAQVSAHLDRYNADLGLGIPIPLRPRIDRLVMKRYRPGGEEEFQPHFDSIDASCARYLVFLWYLNDVASGGETSFCDLGTKVAPKAGRQLVFPPYWMFQHAGLPPVGSDKYILSTYLMF
jgi:hypothetical protein